MKITIFIIVIALFIFSCSSEKHDNSITDSLVAFNGTDSTGKPHEVIEPFHYFVYEDTLDWSKYDQQVTKPLRTKYIESIKIHFDSLAYEERDYSDEKKFNDRFHFIDLNADGKLDVIYAGFSGSEPDIVKIFLNKGNQLIPVFQGYQDLSTLVFDENKQLRSFTLLDFGCCAEYNEYETKYKVDNNFKIELIYQRARLVRTIPPTNIWSKPIKFLTLNDDYTLRSEPIKEDTGTYIYDAIGEGNFVAKYPKNAKGLAWAAYKDKTNRVWWFVEMYPVQNLKKNQIYRRDSLVAPRALGWMSSRFLQKQP